MSAPWLPNDYARCPGYRVDGEWREGCEDCLRRTAPPNGDGWHVRMQPTAVIAFECENRIAPNAELTGAPR